MHTTEEIIRRLESGLTTIAIEFGRLHMAKNAEAEPLDVGTSIHTISAEMQRMNFFLYELQDAARREAS
jgi:hypothetical protein